VIQVISNLVSNAIKFTQQGTISVSARVSKGQQAIGPEEEKKYGASQELEKLNESYPHAQKEANKHDFVDAAVRKREEEETVVVNEGRTRGNWVLVGIKIWDQVLIPILSQSYFQSLPPSRLKAQVWDSLFARILLRLMVEKYGLKIIVILMES